MRVNVIKVRRKISKGLTLLDQEVSKGADQWVFTSEQQASVIRSIFQQLDSALPQNSIPPDILQSCRGLKRLIVDAWPLDSSLAETLIEVIDDIDN